MKKIMFPSFGRLMEFTVKLGGYRCIIKNCQIFLMRLEWD